MTTRKVRDFVTVSVTPEQKAAIESAATIAALPPSVWLRMVGLLAAGEIDPTLFSEQISRATQRTSEGAVTRIITHLVADDVALCGASVPEHELCEACLSVHEGRCREARESQSEAEIATWRFLAAMESAGSDTDRLRAAHALVDALHAWEATDRDGVTARRGGPESSS